MKSFKIIKCSAAIVFTLLLASCEKREANEKIQGDYLYDYELVASYSAEDILSKLLIASIADPDFDTIITTSEYDVDVYKVIYNTNFNSTSILASGLVCIPSGNGSFPLVSFQNGTNTCNSNAPSENSTDMFYSLISVMSGSGYVITIPDYIGFGELNYILHPYHHRQSSNESIIDLIKAAQELIDSKLIQASLNNKLYLLGYSQGGWATLSVLNEIEKNAINNFTVQAAACGAGAYDLVAMSKHVMGLEEYNNPFYLPYFIESRNQNGLLSDPLTLYFKQPYADNIPAFFDGSLCNSELNAEFPSNMSELLTDDMLSNFETGAAYAPLRNALIENSLEAWNVTADLRLYHSNGDKSIPSFISTNMYNAFLDKGVSPSKLTLVLVDLLDHNDAIIPWGIDAFAWINTLEGK
jgi:hypothetical protein